MRTCIPYEMIFFSNDANGSDLSGSFILPKLKCTVFTGNTIDKLAFKRSQSQFEKLVSYVNSNCCRLQISSGYLCGYSGHRAFIID